MDTTRHTFAVARLETFRNSKFQTRSRPCAHKQKNGHGGSGLRDVARSVSEKIRSDLTLGLVEIQTPLYRVIWSRSPNTSEVTR